jgi:hypothetical protein
MRTLMSTGSNKPSYCAPNFLMKNLIRAAGASESCGKFRPHLTGDKKGVAGTLIRDASLSAPGERNERNRCALIKSRIRTPLGKSSYVARTCAGEKIKAARCSSWSNERRRRKETRLCNLLGSADDRVAYPLNCRESTNLVPNC